jgi:hypothetical protein
MTIRKECKMEEAVYKVVYFFAGVFLVSGCLALTTLFGKLIYLVLFGG